MRNKVNIQLRRSKANFCHNGFEGCVKTKNIKKLCSLINSLTGIKNKFSNISEISTKDSNIVDPAQIAECFNDYFVNISPKLAAEINNEPIDQETYNYNNVRPTLDSRFIFQYINVDNVKSSFMNLKTNKSTGLL